MSNRTSRCSQIESTAARRTAARPPPLEEEEEEEAAVAAEEAETAEEDIACVHCFPKKVTEKSLPSVVYRD